LGIVFDVLGGWFFKICIEFPQYYLNLLIKVQIHVFCYCFNCLWLKPKEKKKVFHVGFSQNNSVLAKAKLIFKIKPLTKVNGN
jgi:hypothetical protein